jgi:hypothetical protein
MFVKRPRRSRCPEHAAWSGNLASCRPCRSDYMRDRRTSARAGKPRPRIGRPRKRIDVSALSDAALMSRYRRYVRARLLAASQAAECHAALVSRGIVKRRKRAPPTRVRRIPKREQRPRAPRTEIALPCCGKVRSFDPFVPIANRRIRCSCGESWFANGNRDHEDTIRITKERELPCVLLRKRTSDADVC